MGQGSGSKVGFSAVHSDRTAWLAARTIGSLEYDLFSACSVACTPYLTHGVE